MLKEQAHDNKLWYQLGELNNEKTLIIGTDLIDVTIFMRRKGLVFITMSI